MEYGWLITTNVFLIHQRAREGFHGCSNGLVQDSGASCMVEGVHERRYCINENLRGPVEEFKDLNGEVHGGSEGGLNGFTKDLSV